MTGPHPHDHLFRAVFSSSENVLGILRATLPPAVLAALDPSSLELEEGSYVDDALNGQESDLLFRARLSGRSVRVYILVEHQSTVDPLMPLRLLRYVVRIWERLLRASDRAPTVLPAVIPLVLFHDARPWSGPRRLADLLDLPDELALALGPYVPSLELLIDDLVTQDEASVGAREAGILGRLALVFLKGATDGSDLLSLMQRMQPLLEQLLSTPGGRDGLRLLLSYTMSVRDIPPRALVARVRRVLPTQAGSVMESTYQQILNEGRVEGRAEGALEAKRAILTRAVKARLGPRRGGMLGARARSASEAKLDRAIDLLAATRDDARLLAALEKLLPAARRGPKRRG